MRALAVLAALLLAPFAHAETRVEVCFNYGCINKSVARFSEADLDTVRAMLARTRTPAEEREAIATAVGMLYAVAGRQTPIHADRAGNLLDEGEHGRMDCVDHATTTTAFLNLLARRGWMRHHLVVEPATRNSRIVFEHVSAVIAQRGAAAGAESRYVVDSWFVEHGQPAVVLRLDEWANGGGPDVY